MTGADVHAVTSVLRQAGVEFWITGGWGVDALVGHQTRPHNDLDISVGASDLDDTLALLADMGFEPHTDWLPTRIAVVDTGDREIDVHPLVFEADGSAWLPGFDGARFDYPADSFTTGTIDDYQVPCISAALQLEFHTGYELQGKDIADMAALRQAGLISGGAT